jgi:hypothetical protein
MSAPGMNTYVVFPLGTEELHLYTSLAHRLREGTVLAAKDETAAAMAVRGDLGAVSVRKFAVIEAAVIDLEPPEGFETLSLEPGSHR